MATLIQNDLNKNFDYFSGVYPEISKMRLDAKVVFIKNEVPIMLDLVLIGPFIFGASDPHEKVAIVIYSPHYCIRANILQSQLEFHPILPYYQNNIVFVFRSSAICNTWVRNLIKAREIVNNFSMDAIPPASLPITLYNSKTKLDVEADLTLHKGNCIIKPNTGAVIKYDISKQSIQLLTTIESPEIPYERIPYTFSIAHRQKSDAFIVFTSIDHFLFSFLTFTVNIAVLGRHKGNVQPGLAPPFPATDSALMYKVPIFYYDPKFPPSLKVTRSVRSCSTRSGFGLSRTLSNVEDDTLNGYRIYRPEEIIPAIQEKHIKALKEQNKEFITKIEGLSQPSFSKEIYPPRGTMDLSILDFSKPVQRTQIIRSPLFNRIYLNERRESTFIQEVDVDKEREKLFENIKNESTQAPLISFPSRELSKNNSFIFNEDFQNKYFTKNGQELCCATYLRPVAHPEIIRICQYLGLNINPAFQIAGEELLPTLGKNFIDDCLTIASMLVSGTNQTEIVYNLFSLAESYSDKMLSFIPKGGSTPFSQLVSFCSRLWTTGNLDDFLSLLSSSAEWCRSHYQPDALLSNALFTELLRQKIKTIKLTQSYRPNTIHISPFAHYQKKDFAVKERFELLVRNQTKAIRLFYEHYNANDDGENEQQSKIEDLICNLVLHITHFINTGNLSKNAFDTIVKLSSEWDESNNKSSSQFISKGFSFLSTNSMKDKFDGIFQKDLLAIKATVLQVSQQEEKMRLPYFVFTGILCCKLYEWILIIHHECLQKREYWDRAPMMDMERVANVSDSLYDISSLFLKLDPKCLMKYSHLF